MPYSLSLQAFTPPEFYREPPEAWVRRAAEIAPDMPNLDRLVFRWFEPTEPNGEDRGWNCNDRGQWVLYSAKDIRFVEKDRAEQFRKHWSELPESQQHGLQGVVSDYQHFMWHSRGLYVLPFLVLQGPWGGTPAKYTPAEEAFLEGSACFSEPYPIGMFPACPFDERVVTQITNRDRLLQAANSYERMAQMDTADGMRAIDSAAALVKRQTVLDTWKVMQEPAVEFMKSYLRTKEAASVLPRAPDGLANTIGQWKEHWLEHGALIGVGPAPNQQVHMTVR